MSASKVDEHEHLLNSSSSTASINAKNKYGSTSRIPLPYKEDHHDNRTTGGMVIYVEI